MKTELFVLAPGLINAVSDDEVEATCAGLREMGLYHLPYEHVTVRVKGREIMVVTGPLGLPRTADDEVDEKGHPRAEELYLDVTLSTATGEVPTIVAFNELSGFSLDVTDRVYTGSAADRDGRDRHLEELRRTTADLLIAMLATRNAVKVRTEDKLAKLGIGKKKHKHRYRYTTTISLPSDMDDDDEHPSTGGTKAPHLRRGHIRRRQHYGPARAFVKSVWIEPVFVNADPDFVSQRAHYNFGMPKGENHANADS